MLGCPKSVFFTKSSGTPFTRTTYSHLNPYPNSVPFTRPSRKSSLVMQAALFHVTRVGDASAMVFAKLLQLLLL